MMLRSFSGAVVLAVGKSHTAGTTSAARPLFLTEAKSMNCMHVARFYVSIFLVVFSISQQLGGVHAAEEEGTLPTETVFG